jgi:hypothetical protein
MNRGARGHHAVMRLLPLLAVPLFTACLSLPKSFTTFTATNQPSRPMRARAIDSVEVYTSSVPSRPYAEVGLLRTSGHFADDAVNGMREEAARVGCDGVIVTSTGLDQNNDIVYNGACFLYPDDTTWRAPETAPVTPPSATPSTAPAATATTTTPTTTKPKPARSPECEAALAELRAAPNADKARLSQRVPPECFASPRSTSPGS